jgi:hypothetical protein
MALVWVHERLLKVGLMMQLLSGKYSPKVQKTKAYCIRSCAQQDATGPSIISNQISQSEPRRFVLVLFCMWK